MNANKLYQTLESDFVKPGLTDEWPPMDEISDLISPNFKKRSIGVLCDFAEEVTAIFTAVFPSDNIIERILSANPTDALLFLHHPMIWDIKKAPKVFKPISRELLLQLKNRHISVYALHVPLDNFGKYSTSVTFAKALGIRPAGTFAPYFGGLCGVFGETDYKNVSDLKKGFEEAVHHSVSLYNYGDPEINGRKVAVVAGGGNDIEILEEVKSAGINTFLTGISINNDHAKTAHDFAKANKINILGGTHYSTEKFACIAMCDYFKNLGFPSTFIEDMPDLADI